MLFVIIFEKFKEKINLNIQLKVLMEYNFNIDHDNNLKKFFKSYSKAKENILIINLN